MDGGKNAQFEGLLQKPARIIGRTTKVWCVLDGQSLMFFKENKRSSCIGSVDIADIQTVRKVSSKDNQFEVITSERSQIYTAESSNLCKEWIKHIQHSMSAKTCDVQSGHKNEDLAAEKPHYTVDSSIKKSWKQRETTTGTAYKAGQSHKPTENYKIDLKSVKDTWKQRESKTPESQRRTPSPTSSPGKLSVFNFSLTKNKEIDYSSKVLTQSKVMDENKSDKIVKKASSEREDKDNSSKDVDLTEKLSAEREEKDTRNKYEDLTDKTSAEREDKEPRNKYENLTGKMSAEREDKDNSVKGEGLTDKTTAEMEGKDSSSKCEDFADKTTAERGDKDTSNKFEDLKENMTAERGGKDTSIKHEDLTDLAEREDIHNSSKFEDLTEKTEREDKDSNSKFEDLAEMTSAEREDKDTNSKFEDLAEMTSAEREDKDTKSKSEDLTETTSAAKGDNDTRNSEVTSAMEGDNSNKHSDESKETLEDESSSKQDPIGVKVDINQDRIPDMEQGHKNGNNQSVQNNEVEGEEPVVLRRKSRNVKSTTEIIIKTVTTEEVKTDSDICKTEIPTATLNNEKDVCINEFSEKSAELTKGLAHAYEPGGETVDASLDPTAIVGTEKLVSNTEKTDISDISNVNTEEIVMRHNSGNLRKPKSTDLQVTNKKDEDTEKSTIRKTFPYSAVAQGNQDDETVVLRPKSAGNKGMSTPLSLPMSKTDSFKKGDINLSEMKEIDIKENTNGVNSMNGCLSKTSNENVEQKENLYMLKTEEIPKLNSGKDEDSNALNDLRNFLTNNYGPLSSLIENENMNNSVDEEDAVIALRDYLSSHGCC